MNQHSFVAQDTFDEDELLSALQSQDYSQTDKSDAEDDR